MCAGVVDDDAVADVDFRQFTVDGEFVVVFAERAGDVVDVVTEGVFLADDGDVVVSTIECGAHEVRHAGVESDVVFVCFFLVQRRRDEPAVGAGDVAAGFGFDGEAGEPRRLEDLLVERFDAAADTLYVDGGFLEAVGDAEAAAEVDEFERDAEAFLDFDGEVEHEFRREEEGFIPKLAGDDHGVQAEALDALSACDLVGVEDLVMCKAVFRFGRLADDVVAFDERAGIVAEGEAVGEAGMLFEVVDVADVVEIDDGAEFACFLEFLGGRVVRGQHDLLAFDACCIGEEQLGDGAAVRARAFFVQDLQKARVRRGFDGEVLGEVRRPRERALEAAEVFADGFFIIYVERRRIFLDDFLESLGREGECFFCHKDAS